MNNAVDADSCKLSMLWNWDTVDTCLISSEWHVHTKRQYAGTLLALFLVVILLEGVRRLGRVYDRYIIRKHQKRASIGQAKVGDAVSSGRPFRPNFFQQILRALFYFLQFGTGYLLMLAAMTHNGGVIIALFVGAFFGYLIFGRDTVAGATVIETTDYGIVLEQVSLGKEAAEDKV
uniref:Copper transport protein n=1 Tax=Mycena chlorophos TaxID=658473 RepID=A0ABQ0LLU9_MYCCL|nr:predicted protein [Mycena chlorophos]